MTAESPRPSNYPVGAPQTLGVSRDTLVLMDYSISYNFLLLVDIVFLKKPCG